MKCTIKGGQHGVKFETKKWCTNKNAGVCCDKD